MDVPSPPAVRSPVVTSTTTSDVRRDIERWFVQRGVPQFIEGYSTEQSMDRRAAPLIAAWIVIWIALSWSGRADVEPPLRVAAIAGSLLFVALALVVIGAIRGRPVTRRPPDFDLVDIVVFGMLPPLTTAVVVRDAPSLIYGTLNMLLGIGVIYVVIGFGVLEIGRWALGRLREQLGHIVRLLARTLPLLLILVVFLMFAAEIWEAAHALHAGEFVAVVLLLLFIASLLIVTTFGPEIDRLQAGADWEVVRMDVHDTPAAALPLPPPDVDHVAPPLTWLQRINVDFVVLVTQLLQSTFVGLLTMAFLVVFGLIVVPVGVQEDWIGESVMTVLRFELLGEGRVLSAELLGVSALLSGIVGLYFTGLALTDASYRHEHVTSVLTELRQLMSVRALYLADIRARDAGPAEP